MKYSNCMKYRKGNLFTRWLSTRVYMDECTRYKLYTRFVCEAESIDYKLNINIGKTNEYGLHCFTSVKTESNQNNLQLEAM